MGTSYAQNCKQGPCITCAGTGKVTGNGAAQSNGNAPRIRDIDGDPAWTGLVFRECKAVGCLNLFVVVDPHRPNRSRCDQHRRRRAA
jgi:hypothetical protein